jgi:hypothetical protein
MLSRISDCKNIMTMSTGLDISLTPLALTCGRERLYYKGKKETTKVVISNKKPLTFA